jgi:hypothetical protein
VEYVEQQWINRCWSLHWGYNTRMAHVTPPVPIEPAAHCFGRFYGSRHWPKRIAAVFSEWQRRPALFDDGAYVQYFRLFTTATLVSLHTAVTMRPEDIVSTIGDAGVPPEFITDQLCTWLNHIQDIRFARLSIQYDCNYTAYSLHAAYSPVLERMNVAAAMCRTAALAKLPASLHESLPKQFTFQLPKPMGLMVCNHAKVAHASAADNIACGCVCQQPQFRKFVHSAFGHVLTVDPEVLHGCPVEVKEVWKHGFKFRQPSQLEVVMTDAVRADLGTQCDTAVAQMVSHLRSRYSRCPDYDATQHDFNAFGQLVQQHMKHQLSGTRFVNGSVISFLDTRPHDASATVSPVSLDAMKQHIRRFQQHFVITRMDKFSTVYVLMCKQLYREQTVDDLQNSGLTSSNNLLCAGGYCCAGSGGPCRRSSTATQCSSSICIQKPRRHAESTAAFPACIFACQDA